MLLALVKPWLIGHNGVMLPDPNFEARAPGIAELPESMTGAAMGIFSPGKLAEEILKEANYGTLLAYMVRRFGPPNHGSDDYKQICAWIVTTPQDGLYLSVSPSLSGPRYSFGYLIGREHYHFSRDDNDPVILAGTEALRVAITDLLRPVWVRDQSMNAIGVLADDDDLHGEYDEETEESVGSFAVQPFRHAGHFFPPELMDAGDDWFELLRLLGKLGDKRYDYAAGVKKAVELLRRA